MTDDTIAFLETVVGQPADLVGHSDGTFVAMLVAMQRPELVKRLVMISGGFNKAGEAAPDAEWNVDHLAEFLGPAFGEVSPDGIDHFKVVAAKIGEMAAVEPNLQASELAKVRQRSLVMFSDDDLVTPQHMIDMYAALPNAELAIVPGTSHFLNQEKPDLVNKLLVDFSDQGAGADRGADPPRTQARGQSRLAAAQTRGSPIPVPLMESHDQRKCWLARRSAVDL
jgi:pimeloyl-ACP methyl ester carboxylesterase